MEIIKINIEIIMIVIYLNNVHLFYMKLDFLIAVNLQKKWKH
jgi:hypothetical protein